MNNKEALKNVAIALLFILILLIGYQYFTKPPVIKYVKSVDTVYSVLHTKGEKIYIEKKAKIKLRIDTLKIYKTDTVYYRTPAFIATLDTIPKDTINIEFKFPENRFKFVLKPIQDSIIVKTITITKEKKIERSWYWDYIFVGGGFLCGYVLNDIKGN